MATNDGEAVQIFGQVYHLRGGEDAGHMREVARLVDEKMNIVANQVRTADSYRIAVLTAIHIADELLSSRKRQGETDRRLREKSEKLLALLDEVEGEPRGVAFLSAAD